MGKTIGEMMEEMRIRAGAIEYKGHEYLDLNRFAEDTRHMIIFDVKSDDSPWGFKGDRMRLYLNDTGYEKAKGFQKQGYIQIRSHARVIAGNLHYDSRSQER